MGRDSCIPFSPITPATDPRLRQGPPSPDHTAIVILWLLSGESAAVSC